MAEAIRTAEHSLAKPAEEKASEAACAEALITAAAKGDVSGVEDLLKRGADHLYQVGRTWCPNRVVHHVNIASLHCYFLHTMMQADQLVWHSAAPPSIQVLCIIENLAK